MTPQQKLKWAILSVVYRQNDMELPYPSDNIDALWDIIEEDNPDDLQDAKQDIRGGQAETNIDPEEWSRNYELKSVAYQLPDNSWIGWTYFYGGGKHGDPESVEWISTAYNLACHEEEKTIIVQTFEKKV